MLAGIDYDRHYGRYLAAKHGAQPASFSFIERRNNNDLLSKFPSRRSRISRRPISFLRDLLTIMPPRIHLIKGLLRDSQESTLATKMRGDIFLQWLTAVSQKLRHSLRRPILHDCLWGDFTRIIVQFKDGLTAVHQPILRSYFNTSKSNSSMASVSICLTHLSRRQQPQHIHPLFGDRSSGRMASASSRHCHFTVKRVEFE